MVLPFIDPPERCLDVLRALGERGQSGRHRIKITAICGHLVLAFSPERVEVGGIVEAERVSSEEQILRGLDREIGLPSLELVPVTVPRIRRQVIEFGVRRGGGCDLENIGRHPKLGEPGLRYGLGAVFEVDDYSRAVCIHDLADSTVWLLSATDAIPCM